MHVQPFAKKYFPCAVGQITSTSFRRPAPERGAYAQSPRTLGAGCDGRVGVARRAIPMRTAKSCGPDAPTLASSWWKQFRRRRWQKSPVTGESTKETVKTIAQGMPDCFGEPVVITLVCFLTFAREAAGATGTRHSLRPLSIEGHVDAQL